MPFNLFRKKKQPEEEKPAVAPQEGPAPLQEAKEEPVAPTPEPTQEAPAPIPEQPKETTAPPAQPQLPETPAVHTLEVSEIPNKTYLKAMPLRELADLETIKTEVKNGNIIILRVTPLASKNIEDVKSAVNELYQFAESISGDIARLGEERVVLCPKNIRIWREKTPKSVSSEPLPTAA
jgi:SepF-like predicted cell division protein (DUF552 family)